MARGVNKVILIGNVGADPDVRYSPEGTAFAGFNLATSETWKDRNTGQQQERTEWHRVAISGKLAEITQQYVKKGSKLYIEGQLRTRKWQAQDGSDRYTTEVFVGFNGQMQMLDGRNDGGMPQQQQPQQNGYQNQRHQPQAQQQQYQAGGYDAFDDDIPL